MAASRTILLKGDGQRFEALAAAGTIKPGHLVALNSSGQVAIHAAAGKSAARMFALENDLKGDTIDDAYASGNVVQYIQAFPGAEIYAWVAASAAAIVIGDQVESDGAGGVRKVATDTATDQGEREATIGVAVEAVDNSAGGTAVRLRIRVL